MRHAYLILAHKNPKQLLRLVQALDFKDTLFFIHIDSKIAIRPFIRLFENYPPHKIFFCPTRKDISWGCFSMVEATLSLIKFYIKLGIETDYVHLLSGQDYPVKNVEYIQEYFITNNGKSFMDYFELPTENWTEKGMNRISYLWGLNDEMIYHYNNLDYKEQTQPITHLPNEIIPYGGSQWWSLHINCIRYIAECCNEDNVIYKFYRHTWIPDEMFFHTFILNSPFKDSVVNNNLRHIKWSGRAHPETITLNQIDDLITCPKHFARKFDPFIDNDVLIKLDEHIKSNDLFPKKDKLFLQKKKWCVISAVGKTSLHHKWINKNPRFDLHLIIYDDSYEKFRNDTIYITQVKGYKFKLINNYLSSNPQFLEKYDYFYFPDDDIEISTANIHRLFQYMNEFSLDIAQPAIINRYYSYRHTLQHSNSILRYTNFVEVMQPCFSAEALKKVLFTFNENNSGWGIDFHWGELVDYHRYNMAVIDDVVSIHTRPVQSNHHDELKEYLQKYNLTREIKENIL